MEHLLVGLYEKADGPTVQVFEGAGIWPAQLRQRLLEAELDAPDVIEMISGKSRTKLLAIDALDVPSSLAPLEVMPPLSKHVQQALQAAAIHPATNPPEGRIQSRHLLAAAFSIDNCTVIRLFDNLRPAVRAILEAPSTTPSRGDTDASAAQSEDVMATALPADSTNIGTTAPSAPVAAAEKQVTAPDGNIVTAPTVRPDRGGGTGASNDRAEGEDQLHFSHYVQAFTDLIESPETQPPLVIGIFGSWGAGKSFLLTSLTRSLARRRQELNVSLYRKARRWLIERFRSKVDNQPARRPAYVYSVSFNAWEYNASKTIWPRLVRRVLDTVGAEVRWQTRPLRWLQKGIRTLRRNFFRKLRAEWSSLAGWLVVGALLAWIAIRVLPDNFEQMVRRVLGINLTDAQFSIVAGVGALVAIVKLLQESFFAPFGGWVTAVLDDEASYGREDDAMRAIREDLDLLDRQLCAENSRVLIVVDDLDRCEPEKAIEVLQAINLMLDRGSFIIALGIDARVITAAVERHYKELLGPAGITGYEYLDKIVQIPFKIPEPTSKDLSEFLAKQLGNPSPPPRNEQVAAASSAAGSSDAGAVASAGTQDVTPLFTPGQTSGTLSAAKAPSSVMPGPGDVPQKAIETERGTRDVPMTPLPPLAFTYDELQAFQRIASYLRPNPRHIKRIVNVYALVRALAERLGERRILDKPSTTVVWLALNGQWPYATREMLRHHDGLERARAVKAAARQQTTDPPVPPLQHLLTLASPELDPANRRRFDHESEYLDQLVAAGAEMTWDELRTLRRFTLNFNPALESELRVSEQRKTRQAQTRTANIADAATKAAAVAAVTAPGAPAALPQR